MNVRGNVDGKSLYHEVCARSLADPEGFWAEAAKEIDWIEPPKKIFDPSQGVYGRWFSGGVVNTCYNALDRHVERGRADQIALQWRKRVRFCAIDRLRATVNVGHSRRSSGTQPMPARAISWVGSRVTS